MIPLKIKFKQTKGSNYNYIENNRVWVTKYNRKGKERKVSYPIKKQTSIT